MPKSPEIIISILAHFTVFRIGTCAHSAYTFQLSSTDYGFTCYNAHQPNVYSYRGIYRGFKSRPHLMYVIVNDFCFADFGLGLAGAVIGGIVGGVLGLIILAVVVTVIIVVVIIVVVKKGVTK